MISASHFHSGLTYDDFLSRYGSETDRRKWAASDDAVELTDSQQQLLSGFVREMRVLCFAGAWCGDCVQQCPIFRRFELASDKVQLRMVDRDADNELKSAMQLCGAARVPQLVIFTEEDLFAARLGDRTLTKYRQMADALSGNSCSSGIVAKGDPVQASIIQDWLNEFERVQLTLRTSARLREIHGD